MTTQSTSPLKYVRYLCQYFIVLILLSTGIGKLLDVQGFIGVIDTYQVIPEMFQALIAIIMVLVELRLAEWLITSKKPQWPALASVVLHGAFTCWAMLALIRGLDIPNCGCFGVFWARPLTWGTVGEDIFMLGVSFAAYFLAKRGH